jgi:hypothetical protein
MTLAYPQLVMTNDEFGSSHFVRLYPREHREVQYADDELNSSPKASVLSSANSHLP